MEGVHVGVSGHISNQDVERPGQVHGFVVPLVGTSKGSALILLESTLQWPVELPGGLHLCSATAPPSPATKGAMPPTQGTFGEQLDQRTRTISLGKMTLNSLSRCLGVATSCLTDS